MSIIETFNIHYHTLSRKSRETVDLVLQILMLPTEEGLDFEQKTTLISRILDDNNDFASDAEIQAVRSRFFQRAS